ncbi:hypothetical protein U0C82_17245 [Fulvimarina sp. 2208YS6-2-32]|uniref:Uncharacterized protein n=1 Tax=Fulvimarina uroteuthidis TaxID=3098149 RepID=A0ABU5I698_9HYPH|nr:hypothetical protein [Fulvimarina sp. 2208YS6-2-32]MDY8110887.1 hypothetical protein [Fulvimarina sp. 2208YS6-2-32]
MAVSALSRWAREAPVPVFVAIGDGMRERVERLFCDPGIERAATPRHAAILLIAGRMRLEDREDLRRLHDQMPHPRATLLWDAKVGEALGDAEIFSGGTLESDKDAGEAVRDHLERLWQDLASGERPSEPDLLHDEPPNPWEGIGPHGQGGKGMMGGTPYGRPMAMTSDDLRDGLALDTYTARFGPFLPMFPPGLLLEMTLQGDVIQAAKVLRPPLSQKAEENAPAALSRLARLLDLLGLPALGQRTRLAVAGDRSSSTLEKLGRAIRWSGAMLAIPPGLGAVEGQGDLSARLNDLLAVAGGSSPATRPELPESAHLSSLLPGLEWSEAMLVLNSFDDKTLSMLAMVMDEPDEERDGHDHDGDHMRHDHGGHHDHGGSHHEHGRHQGEGGQGGHGDYGSHQGHDPHGSHGGHT